MAETPRLDLPYIAASQYQKEVVHNQSLDRLDLLCQCSVLDRNLATPPASPALGDAYIVGLAATGAWAGHENDLALWVSSQWQLIAPLPGFQCWVLDEAVQVYWSGTAWTIVSGGGGGVTTFLALTDTPNAYAGQAGKTLLVNVGETALEFGTAAGSAPMDAAYVTTVTHAGLSAERVVTANTQIAWDTATAGQLAATLVAHGVTLEKLAEQVPGTLLGRGDSLDPVDEVQPIIVGPGLELVGTTLQIVGGESGVDAFLELTDTPDTYSGQGGKVVAVNTGGTALEFITGGGGGTLATGAIVERTTSQTITNTTATAVIFTTEVLDQGTYWESGQPTRLTIPTTGWYTVTVNLEWSVSGTGFRDVTVRVNGTDYRLISRENQQGSGTTVPMVVAGSLYLTAGDYVEVSVYHSAGAGLNVANCRTSLVQAGSGSSGVTDFLSLTDTPNSYSGQASKVVRVNAGATATEFGPVLGTMAEQNSNAVAITGGTATGLAATLTSLGVTGTTTLQGATQMNNHLVVAWPGQVGLGIAAGPHMLTVAHDKTTTHGIVLQPSTGDTGAAAELIFNNYGGGGVGSIQTTATTTSYNTTSDARLKEAVAPLAGALARIQALRPVSFRWQADSLPGIGFLAHELMTVVPEAVIGLPDAVDAEGNIVPQQVDHSKIVPWLTAGLQAALDQIDALTARIGTLEEQLGL